MPEGQAPVFASSSVRSGWGAANPYAEVAHLVVWRVFLATTVLASGFALVGVRPPSVWSWLYAAHIVVAVLTTLAALARRLPLQNVVACGLALSLTMGMALAMVGSSQHGQVELVPGASSATKTSSIQGLGWQAWPAPLLWTAVLLASRQTAKVLLQPWRRQRQYGWWLLGAATGLAWVAVVAASPLVDRMLGWWSWPKEGWSWYGVPPVWLVLVPAPICILLVLGGVWLIAKRPSGRPADFEPVWVWSGLMVWFTLGNLGAGHWVAAGVSIVAAAFVVALAWRTARLPINPASGPGG